jgi:two-component system, cell cycle response regulator DivK
MTTVLLVDDQLHLCAIHTEYLQRHGYRVLTARDGDAAVVAAHEHAPDVILLDHSMPRRNGVEVAHELKADPATSAIPIIMMTALPYGAVGRRALDAGCVGFVAKPCGPRRLLLEIERLTARRSA